MNQLLKLLLLISLSSCLIEKDKHTSFSFPLIKHKDINLGGYSGLSRHERSFFTVTDRGPNSHKKDVDGDGIEDRIFTSPTYNPVVLKFELKDKIVIKQVIELKNKNKTLTGLPNLDQKSSPLEYDERPFDSQLRQLPHDSLGLDPEGIAIDQKGRIWISEEYGPSLFIFDSQGSFIKRLVPKSSKRQGEKTLPEFLRFKKLNRGLEGLTFTHNKIYTILQSPIPTEKKKKKYQRMIHLFEIDSTSLTLTGHYLYPLNKKMKKIGALTFYKDQKFFVIEQDGKAGKKSHKKVFEIDLKQATNLAKSWKDDYLSSSFKQLSKKDINAVSKKEVLDLNLVGFKDVEKIEGLEYKEPYLFIINDNDFSVHNEDELSIMIRVKLTNH